MRSTFPVALGRLTACLMGFTLLLPISAFAANPPGTTGTPWPFPSRTTTGVAISAPQAGTSAAGYLTTAANGAGIPMPTSKKTYPVTDAGRTIQVPEVMVYIPGGDFTAGAGPTAAKVHLDGYCIGKFDVTNAEFKAFLQATGSKSYPRYWTGGTYPEGKANHPVLYVSLTQAQAYADWVGKQTGWNVAIPSADQWEKAARGPNGFLYPWGNESGTSYQGGVLKSKFSFNGVTAAYYLKNQPKMEVTYDNPKSPHNGEKTTVDKIAGIDGSGNATYLEVGPNGSVRGWVNHQTYTGFIYTDLFTKLEETGGNTVAVGTYEDGKSAYGCYDMAGNVWDWTTTMITATNGAEKGKQANEIRGGSWYANGTSCKSTGIGEGRSATGAYNTVGFRIVMLPAAGR